MLNLLVILTIIATVPNLVSCYTTVPNLVSCYATVQTCELVYKHGIVCEYNVTDIATLQIIGEDCDRGTQPAIIMFGEMIKCVVPEMPKNEGPTNLQILLPLGIATFVVIFAGMGIGIYLKMHGVID